MLRHGKWSIDRLHARFGEDTRPGSLCSQHPTWHEKVSFLVIAEAILLLLLFSGHDNHSLIGIVDRLLTAVRSGRPACVPLAVSVVLECIVQIGRPCAMRSIRAVHDLLSVPLEIGGLKSRAA